MAEGARLESVYTGNRIVGSNPTPSARGQISGKPRTSRDVQKSQQNQLYELNTQDFSPSGAVWYNPRTKRGYRRG